MSQYHERYNEEMEAFALLWDNSNNNKLQKERHSKKKKLFNTTFLFGFHTHMVANLFLLVSQYLSLKISHIYVYVWKLNKSVADVFVIC